MREQIITTLGFEELRQRTLAPDAFVFCDDKPQRWLQRACLTILRRLGCYYYKETVEMRQHVIRADSFIERLLCEAESVAVLLQREPGRLLIGAEDYAELMGDKETRECFSFDAEYGHNGRICGLRVTVIPWMRGALVLPDKLN